MKNITIDIKRAIETDTLWSVDQFYSFIELALNDGLQISYWNDEENWASVLVNDSEIGYVWKKYPLILISKAYLTNLEKLLLEFPYVVTIVVSSLTSKEFVIESDQVLIDRLGYLTFNEPMAASDLWFNTV